MILLAAGIWAYDTSMAGVFLFDDAPAIMDNPHIRTLWPLTVSMNAPAGSTLTGRPVAGLTFAINYAFAPAYAKDAMSPESLRMPSDHEDPFYANVWGYHAVNIFIHLMASLLLFGIVRRSLRTSKLRERFGSASTVLGFFAALIWLLHPLHTESVTYIVQRVESLAGLFYLLTLYCAIRASEAEGRANWWTAASVAACALGMASKEIMVTAPVAVWLWDFVFLDGRAPARWRLYAGLGATWAVLAAVLVSSAEAQSALQLLVSSEGQARSLDFSLGWTRWSYLCTQAGVIVHYLRLAIVPVPLVFSYFDWAPARSLVSVAPQAALLAALLGFSVVALVRRRPLGFLGAWFFLILAPTSSVVPIPTEVAAEHRMYLPLAAVVTLAVLSAYIVGCYGLTRIASQLKSNRHLRRHFGAVVGLCGGRDVCRPHPRQEPGLLER